MSKWIMVAFACVIWPGAACAGQANSQFQVGITITGKRASAPPSTNAAAEPAQAINAPAAVESKPRTLNRNLLMRSKRQAGTAARPATSP